MDKNKHYTEINKGETGKNIMRLMEFRGLSVKDVQEYLGLESIQAIYKWFKGKSVPSLERIYALSELFGVPIDNIVRGNRKGDYLEHNYRQWERLNSYYEFMRRNRLVNHSVKAEKL